MSNADPRIFFAAERTLLAWVRTGITIIALGFVVSRFGLFLRLLAAQADAKSGGSGMHFGAVLGIAFVLLGASCIAVAAVQHQRFVATLPEPDLPQSYSRLFAVALSFVLSGLGIGLAAYMVMSQR
jgi:putative membrane protein